MESGGACAVIGGTPGKHGRRKNAATGDADRDGPIRQCASACGSAGNLPNKRLRHLLPVAGRVALRMGRQIIVWHHTAIAAPLPAKACRTGPLGDAAQRSPAVEFNTAPGRGQATGCMRMAARGFDNMWTGAVACASGGGGNSWRNNPSHVGNAGGPNRADSGSDPVFRPHRQTARRSSCGCIHCLVDARRG